MIVGRTWPLSLFRQFGWFRGSEGSLSDNILSQGVFCRCAGNLGGLRGLQVAGLASVEAIWVVLLGLGDCWVVMLDCRAFMASV